MAHVYIVVRKWKKFMVNGIAKFVKGGRNNVSSNNVFFRYARWDCDYKLEEMVSMKKQNDKGGKKSFRTGMVLNNPFEGEPYGWIQFKGTDICIDINCECGELSHYDGDFAYEIKCPYCGIVWGLNGHIKLVKLKKDEYNSDYIKLAEL